MPAALLAYAITRSPVNSSSDALFTTSPSSPAPQAWLWLCTYFSYTLSVVVSLILQPLGSLFSYPHFGIPTESFSKAEIWPNLTNSKKGKKYPPLSLHPLQNKEQNLHRSLDKSSLAPTDISCLPVNWTHLQFPRLIMHFQDSIFVHAFPFFPLFFLTNTLSFRSQFGTYRH